MFWWRKEPGHQQPWCWYNSPEIFRFQELKTLGQWGRNNQTERGHISLLVITWPLTQPAHQPWYRHFICKMTRSLIAFHEEGLQVPANMILVQEREYVLTPPPPPPPRNTHTPNWIHLSNFVSHCNNPLYHGFLCLFYQPLLLHYWCPVTDKGSDKPIIFLWLHVLKRGWNELIVYTF